jgi:hypothetical protein
LLRLGFELAAESALVEARYPLPAGRTDAETGRFLSAGRLYDLWVGAIMRREFTPLWW